MMGDAKVFEFEPVIYTGATKGEDKGKLRLALQGVGWKSVNGEEIFTVQSPDIRKISWMRVAKDYSIRIHLKSNSIIKFEGFKRDDFDTLQTAVRQNYHMTLEPKELSLKGWNWGKIEIQPSTLNFTVSNKTLFEVPYSEVGNTNTVAKNEFNVEFTQHDIEGNKKKSKEDSLVEIRFYSPGMAPKMDGDVDGEVVDDDQQTAAEFFYETIKAKADLSVERSDNIVSFKELPFLTPRGRYDLDMYPTFLRLRGKTYDYKINYSNINRLFLLPKPDDKHILFVVGLDPPLRQGQTRYPFLVLQFLRDEEMDVELNIDEKTINEQYDGRLKKSYERPTFEVVSEIFRGLAHRKVTVPDAADFTSRMGALAIKCSMKANEGYLYPLEKSLLFIPKPTTFMPHVDISLVELSPHERYVTAKVMMKTGAEHVFSSISREELENFVNYLSIKKIRVKNQVREESQVTYAESDEDDGGTLEMSPHKRSRDDDEEEEESPDEDFIASSSDNDVAEEYNSDYESDSGASKKGSEGSDSENTTSRTHSAPPSPKPKKDKPISGKKEKEKSDKVEPKKKRQKKEKDSTKPKRATTAFIYFSNDLRARVKEEMGGNPSMTEVTKVLGEKWRQLAPDMKEKYEDMARRDKERFHRENEEWKAKQKTGSVHEGGSARSPEISMVQSELKWKQETGGTGGGKKDTEYKSVEFIEDSDDN